MKKTVKIIIAIVILAIVIATTMIIQKFFVTNRPPTADAGHDLYVDPGQPVIFNGISYDTDGKIVLEEWDFDGDGKFDWNSTATSSPPTYTFFEPNRSYRAVYRVTDNGGLSSSDICNVYVEPIPLFSMIMEKTNFSTSEPINVTISLKNLKNRSIFVSAPSFGFGNVGFTIIDSNLRILKRRDIIIPGIPEIIKLAPHQTVTYTITNLQLSYNLTLGKYLIKAWYFSGMGEVIPNQWVGTLYSEMCTITIKDTT
ncbi:MAG: hypothetical protein DRN28_02470 [Thermoplasmata archaeon]|nr:MAG: hypothetical protein DRN28_02470 [Thermoplasmata archaeon]